MQTSLLSVDLKPGDSVTVPKSAFNMVQHYAVYLGYDYEGTHWMIENVAGRGVVLTRAVDFFTANPSVNKVVPFGGTNEERRLIVQKALYSVGQPYNLINYNCEHFATGLQTGKARSRQVEVAFIAAALLLVIGLAFRE